MIKIIFFILLIISFWTTTVFAATPELVSKASLQNTQGHAAAIMKNRSIKYVPNPQKWDYRFTDNKNEDYWLDKSSIIVTGDKTVRFNYCRSYKIFFPMNSRIGTRFCVSAATINYEDNILIVSKNSFYDLNTGAKLDEADIRDITDRVGAEDFALKELGQEQPLKSRKTTKKLAEILRPYLQNHAQHIQPVQPKVNTNQKKTPIKFI